MSNNFSEISAAEFTDGQEAAQPAAPLAMGGVAAAQRFCPAAPAFGRRQRSRLRRR